MWRDVAKGRRPREGVWTPWRKRTRDGDVVVVVVVVFAEEVGEKV